LFSALLLFLFAEEISWGQRILGIEVPERIANLSFQGELNLHNIKIMQKSNNAVSTYGAKLLLLYLVVPPFFLRFFPQWGRWLVAKGLPFTSLSVSLLAVINYLLLKSALFVFGAEGETVYSYRISEIYEVNLEFLLFVFAFQIYYNLKAQAADKIEPAH
jgi:hypothetical protein